MEAIYYVDGFLILRDLKEPNSILGETLSFDSNRIDESVEFLKRQGIKSINLGNYFHLQNLDFLKKCSFIEGLSILNNNITDYEGLNYLKNLRSFSAPRLSQPIDFANFPNLEVVGLEHSKQVVNLSRCKNIFWLWLEKYNEQDLTEFKTFEKIKYLNFYRSSFENLVGIENFTELEYIKLDTIKNLKSLKGLDPNLTNLRTLDIYNCKNLSDYDDIAKVKSLKRIFLDKTGDSQDIKFIKDLSALSLLTIGFKVLDGEMQYVDNIETIWFKDFPHYNRKMKNFKK